MSAFRRRPPIRGMGVLWLAGLVVVYALDWWVKHRWGYEPGLTTAEVCVPPLLMLWLLFHPRPRGLAAYGLRSPDRERLGVDMVPEPEAERRHRTLTSRLLLARVGPLWARCFVAGLIAGRWLRSMGLLEPDWILANAIDPEPTRLARELRPLATLAATCYFVSHIANWERVTLADRPPSRLEAVTAFAGSAVRALVGQALAAAASFAFIMLTLMIVGFVTIGAVALRDFDLPAWFPAISAAPGPHVVAFYAALPGMFLLALRDAGGLRADVTMRTALLARELMRERGGTTGKAASMDRLTGAAGRPATG